MDNYRYGEEDERRILQCACCDAAAVTDARQRGADTMCALCGMAMTDAAVDGGDYFSVVMKAGCGRARLRRRG
jgi:hypothetical protein